MSLSSGSNGDVDIENTLVDTVREGEGGTNRESAGVQPQLIQGIRKGDGIGDYLNIHQRYKE